MAQPRFSVAKARFRVVITTLQRGEGGVFWTKFEPILNKIPTLTFDCRPQGDNPAQRLATA